MVSSDFRSASVRARAAAAAFALAGALAVTSSASAAPGYLRYPDIYGDHVVFSAEGDLWIVSAAGGTAAHLTSGPGMEYFPRFSPDGTKIAFTGFYDGNADVFVIPAGGGEPQRLTWCPGPDEVLGWTPDGADILFRSRRDEPHGDWQVYAVSANGGDARVMPVGRASRLAIDPDTGAWAINRTDRERATWKRYRGGTNEDIWVGHPGKNDFKDVTSFSGYDMMPMWYQGRIYYACDKGGTQEIWSMKPDGSDQKSHTSHGDWDVRYPELGDKGRIVYQVAGDIGLYDIAKGSDAKLAIDLPSERVLTRVRYPDATKYLVGFDLSPDGERLAIESRGEIFSVPAKKGVTLTITGGSGARERGAAFDPDSKRIYYITDATGEEEIRSIDSWGRGDASVVVAAGKTGWHFPPVPSPDGKWIAWGDQTQTLYVAPAKGGAPQKVDQSEQAEIREYTWSPDGRYLAYTKVPRSEFSSIWIWDSKDGSLHRATGEATIDFSPAWDPDGRWLAFLSLRTVNPVLDGARDFQNVDVLSTKPYLVLLKADGKNPFEDRKGLPDDDADKKKDEKKGDKDKADKGKDKDKDKKGDEKGKDEEKKKPEPVVIDWDGLARRVVEVPVDAGILNGLGATSKHLYWLSHPVQGIAGDDDGGGDHPDGKLVMYSFEDKEEKTVSEGVSGYDLEPGASKLAFMKDRGKIFVIDADAPAGDDLSKSAVSLDDVVIDLDPREEWRQMFFEGWRHMRDFVWTPDLAGVNWTAVRDHYATLLPRLAIRDDLRDLMGEMIGELSTSHTYVYGGDMGMDPRNTPVGLLGGRFQREGSAYKITKIFRGDVADLDRAPLDAPDVHVQEGEYIVAVNHRPLPSGRPLEAAFENLAGRKVVLGISKTADGKGARDVVVEPVPDDGRLRYIDWVRMNREAVAKASGGKLGYIHLPDMGSSGLIEFNRWFYPQLDKEGMIVDCRWNGGGFVSQMMVERLRRKVDTFDRSRGGGINTYPYRTLNGPFVVLLNEEAGSDGDIFPYMCQKEGLAPVIGQRSWGGVIGIRDDKRLVDGGHLTQPEYAMWDPKKGWAIENHGVDPDIEVANYPQDEAQGLDPQLDRGIQETLKRLAANPPPQPTFQGAIPDKSREGYRAREAGK
ncbi:MAG: S41 family peptidase [bacterium]